ncbi:ABC transporter ATP-binding protein [Fodinicola feengrottensis]|uniref:ABC transporter ATP-binding protein n=1 Tax=Fodinicola feengrottensis TaxID=435914 RepID=A0ABN2GCC9_9ACTN
MSHLLPIASTVDTRRYAGQLMRQHPRGILRMLVLHGLAAVAGLAGPRLLGELVDGVTTGITVPRIDTIAALFAAFLIAQTVLIRYANYCSSTLGEQVLAELREEFVERVTELPLSTVEKAGSGDLLTRATSDVGALSRVVRAGIPEVMVAVVTSLLTIAAAAIAGWQIFLPCFILLPLLSISTRWYLKHATPAYLAERARYARLLAGVHETVDGARTVEALRLPRRRVRRSENDIAAAFEVEKYTLGLRTRWYPTVEVTFLLPMVIAVAWGGWLYSQGVASLGAVTAVTLYVIALNDPLDSLISWLDEVQVGAAALARVVGVAQARAPRMADAAEPIDEQIQLSDVSFAYDNGKDVLHDVSLQLRPGERLAVVGPSGAGKSTIGRLLAGIARPRTGEVTVGGVPIADLPPDRLRSHVALVTQEYHVFVGTIADNLRLAAPAATDEQLRAALVAVDADAWVDALPDGLATAVGSGQQTLEPGQAQQLALARLVLADPHTLVLDEATSLMDPSAARHLEQSLAAVMRGRTVVAIAHRLQTAHDADRVAVVENGRISEIGSHHDLIAAGGSYASLWRSWQAAD